MLDYEVPSSYPATPVMNKGVNFVYPLPPVLEPLIDNVRSQAAIVDDRNSSITGYRDVVMHIDRLLPSVEFRQNGVQSDVLWRFSVWRGEKQLASSCYVCREADVSQYIAEAIMRKVDGERGHFTPHGPSGNSGPNTASTGGSDPFLRKSQVVFTQEGSIQFPWIGSPDRSPLPVIYLSISVMGFSRQSSSELLSEESLNTVKIGLCAEISEISEEERLFLECSPAEIRKLLSVPPNLMPLGDYLWWTDSSRKEDLWPKFLEKIAVVQAEGVEELAPTLCLKFDKLESSALAERIDGALSTQEALFCAYELLDVISLEEEADSGRLSVKLEYLTNERIFLNLNSAVANMNLDEQPFQWPYPPPRDNEVNSSFAAYLKENVAPTIEAGHQWEQIAMHSGSLCPSASMLASGALAVVTQVPGANEIGRKGLWFPNKSSKPHCEFTRVAARFFRDSRISTSDSVLVNLTLCMDSSMVFSTMLAWEDFSSHPPATPGEEVSPAIPMICNRGVKGDRLALLRTSVDSPLSERVSPTVVIFSTTPCNGKDYAALETLQAYSLPGGRAGKRLPLQQTESKLQKKKQLEGLKRYVPFRNVNGFQEQVCVPLLGVDSVLGTVVFGITKLGAQSNSMGVNSRNIWHSTLPITENINRSDYRPLLIMNITSCPHIAGRGARKTIIT